MTTTITPADIRAGTGTLIFAESERKMIADAIEIADSCARSDIECHCRWMESPGVVRWYDTDPAQLDKDEKPAIEQAVRYLDSRGLLLRHTTRPTWVRFVEAPG